MLPKEPWPHKGRYHGCPNPPQQSPLPASQPPNRWGLRRAERSGHLPRHTTEAGRCPTRRQHAPHEARTKPEKRPPTA